MKVVVRREMLGAREQAWSLWTGKDVMEVTSRQIKEMIGNGERVSGLKIVNDELVPDREGFFTSNIMEHRISNNFKPMIDNEVMVNQFYICIGKRIEDKNTVYECISTKFEQAVLSESDMRAYLKLGIVSGGAKLDGEKIVVAPELEEASSPKPEPTVKEPKKPQPDKKKGE
jgi:hypothetical protein